VSAGCEFWVGHDADGTGGRPCGAPAVERLVYVNALICSHVHSEGAIDACADHLAAHMVEAFPLLSGR
jgi:hypothetical protein